MTEPEERAGEALDDEDPAVGVRAELVPVRAAPVFEEVEGGVEGVEPTDREP